MNQEMQPLDSEVRAAMLKRCVEYIGRPRGWNDDIEALLGDYTDSDLEALFDFLMTCNGKQVCRDMMSVVLEEDIPLLRTVIGKTSYVYNRLMSVEDIALVIHGLRYIGAMSEEDTDATTLTAHLDIARLIYLDRYAIPYHQDDELMQVVQDFPDRLDDIRRYRMERGNDSGGLREHLSAARPLADGAL